MKIILDAMGGDNAPEAPVLGAVEAAKTYGIEIVLVGRGEDILAVLKKHGIDNLPEGMEISNADDVVDMHDDPASIIHKRKNSSMVIGLKMLADGLGDAFVSAGSTGALLTGATLITKRIHGIRRAALAPVLPNGDAGVMLIDCGANVECTAEYLLQFAYMGSFYAKKLMGCENPRVGLLNVGTEDTKGGELQHQAFALLKEAHEDGRINFIGNVEGTGVFAGAADVVVTDGFTGNVLLKSTEGVIKYMMKQLKGVFYKNTANKLAAAVLKKDLGIMKKSMDVNEVGGTAMIGISKPVIKAHGSSNAACIFSAMRQAQSFAESGIISDIEANIEYMKLRTEAKAE